MEDDKQQNPKDEAAEGPKRTDSADATANAHMSKPRGTQSGGGGNPDDGHAPDEGRPRARLRRETDTSPGDRTGEIPATESRGGSAGGALAADTGGLESLRARWRGEGDGDGDAGNGLAPSPGGTGGLESLRARWRGVRGETGGGDGDDGDDDDEDAPAPPGAYRVSGAAAATEGASDLGGASAPTGDAPAAASGDASAAPPNVVSAVAGWVMYMARNAPLVEGTAIAGTRGAGEGSGRDSGRKGPLQRCRRPVVLIAALVFVGVVVVTTAVVLSRKKSDEVMGDPSPSPLFEELRMAVSTVSDDEALSDPTSPQFAALSWMANENKLILSPTDDLEAVIQRYLMVLFYFSTAGEGWGKEKCSFFERTINASVMCEFWGTTCWEDYDNIKMEQAGKRPYLSGSWHECAWEGVGCYEGTDTVGAIVMIDNNLKGEIPQEIGALKLQHFHVPFNCGIGGTIPDSIRNFGVSMKQLTVGFNKITGTIPDFFDALPNLTHFASVLNRVSGPIPKTLNGLRKLKFFSAGFNALNGTIPLDFSTLPSLEQVFLGNNALSGPIPPSLSDWTSGVYIDLTSNQLTGTIPESLGRLSGLKVLNLLGNYLNGTIPSSLFNITELLALTLSLNDLTGTIPETVGRAKSLQWLFLDNNLLTGTIPMSIGDQRDLWAFAANSNGLTGTIPSSMGHNLSLGYIELGDNGLVGTFPDTFKNATSLEELNISRNNLTGSMNMLCDLEPIPLLIADCGGDDAEIECDCCQFCCTDNDSTICFEFDTKAFFNRYCSLKEEKKSQGKSHVICGGKDEDV